MANPNDRYRNGPQRGGLHYSASHSHTLRGIPPDLHNDPPPYLRSRTPSFDNGDDRVRLDPRTQPADELFYNSAYPDMDQSGQAHQGQPVQRSQFSAQPGSYFGSPPGASDGTGYSNQQNQYIQQGGMGYTGGYQQAGANYDSAPYPTTPGYNGNSPPGSHHQPYNPAAFQPGPPQRHASNATGYSSASPQYSPNIGTSYNPSSFNTTTTSTTTPYPNYTPAAPKLHPAQQPYLNGPSTSPFYSQYPTRTQYATQNQPLYGTQQQFSPGLTHPHSQIGYQPPPPPQPPQPPVSPPATFAPPAPYGNQQYPNPPYPSHDTPPLGHYPSQKFVGIRPETHYSSDSDISLPSDHGNGQNPLPNPSTYGNQALNYYPTQPLPSPPPPAPPTHGYGHPDRANSNRHPQYRPLPTRPNEYIDQDSMFQDVESAVMSLGSNNQVENRHQVPRKKVNDIEEDLAPDPLFSTPNRYQTDNSTVSNSNGGTGLAPYGKYPIYSDSSDAEAVGGLEAMRVADADDRSRLAVEEPEKDDSDYGVGVDLSMMGGGFAGETTGFYAAHSRQNSYAADEKSLARTSSSATYDTNYSLGRTTSTATASTAATTITQDSTPTDEPKTARRQGMQGLYEYGIPDDDVLHPFPDFSSAARVDTWGTGGLAEPGALRRLSFDEGDDGVSRRSSSQSPVKQVESDPEFPELFYHPGPSSSAQTSPSITRPLPSLPEPVVPELPQPDAANYRHSQSSRYSVAPQRQSSIPPLAPGMVGLSIVPPSAPQFPRSTSMSAAHVNSSHSVTPARSKTDAAIAARANRQSVQVRSPITGDFDDPQNSLAIGLPSIPLSRRKKFEPGKLSTRDFRKCDRPWALSGIVAWTKEMAEGEQDLKERTLVDGIAALFTHYVPTMNIADAETLAARVVRTMLNDRALIKEEEWVKFGAGEVSGVIYQICGGGCYAPKLHELECPGRCYSHHCSRTLKKISLLQHPDEQEKKSEDWATFWKIKKEDIGEISKKEIERQNNLHEVVQTESEYMEHLWILGAVYRDQVLASNPPMIKPTKLDQFVRDVFGKAEAVRKVSEEHLLPQLKFRQREQGPWITGFSDIFREWIRKAKNVYIEYAANFPRADMLMRREADRNILFRTFLDQCRQDPRTRRLDWVTFLKAPITRLQRYSLLLSTVLKHTIVESEEKQNLIAAIEEIRAVTLECDSRVDEMTKKVVLMELGAKLIMRPGMEVDLRLDEKGREVIHKGDLQRNTNRFNFIETHAILFDHYLVLAKTVQQREVTGGAKHERYDVSRMPIPMDLLVLESTNDDPVIKSTANKLGLGTTAVKTGDPRGGRANTMSPAGQTLSHTSTNLSTGSAKIVPTTVLNGNDERIMYPFRIKHLGKAHKTDENTYTLYAPSAQNRQDWCEKIIMAKERHAASLHLQNAEPFRLKVMADTAFGYDSSSSYSQKPINVRGTPLDRAIKEVEQMFEHAGPRPQVICKATVNCATAFTDQFAREMVAIGTDYGVYLADAHNPRGWVRAINVAKVTQIAVLEEFSLFLVLADKALIAYHLDVVLPPNGQTDTSKRQPQKLSGARDVGFFATGRMKERSLVFYKKREGLSSTFKVLEPVFQKATEKKGRFSRKATTEFFREFDEFYIPTDCYGINLFHTTLAIQTAKGFEVLTLDKKHPTSIPELKAAHVTAIANKLNNQRPLGMFRLSDIEFILCYEECAVYVNKHGDISRSVIMEFVGKAKTVAVYGRYLLLFDNDFVEIRNAENGRLRQVIAGRDCKCLDDAQTGGTAGLRTIKVAMAHPEVEGRQLVVELLLNEGQSD